MDRVSVSVGAYAKVVLHAAKYPANCIGGYLLGRAGESGATVTVIDVLPICHGVPVGPIFEIADSLVRERRYL